MRAGYASLLVAAAMGSIAIKADEFDPWNLPSLRHAHTPMPSNGKSYNYCTNWQKRLNGQTNGKRECARRVRQMSTM